MSIYSRSHVLFAAFALSITLSSAVAGPERADLDDGTGKPVDKQPKPELVVDLLVDDQAVEGDTIVLNEWAPVLAIFGPDYGYVTVNDNEPDALGPAGAAVIVSVLGGAWYWMGANAECQNNVASALEYCEDHTANDACCETQAARYSYTCLWGGSDGPGLTELAALCEIERGPGHSSHDECTVYNGELIDTPCIGTDVDTGDRYECTCTLYMDNCQTGEDGGECDCESSVVSSSGCEPM